VRIETVCKENDSVVDLFTEPVVVLEGQWKLVAFLSQLVK